jgi:hypothetical protein
VVARNDIQGLFLLNGTARFVWEALTGGAASADIAQDFAAQYGLPETLARRDVEATLTNWSRDLLSSSARNGTPHVESSSVLARFESSGAVIEMNCVLNGHGFRVLMESGDLVEEIAPRLARAVVPHLPPGAPFITFALANGDDRIFVFRDGVCIAEEEKTSAARAILLQEITSHCDPDRETRAIIHAGACGTASGCVILAGPSHAGKSTLCAALMAGGFFCYSEDSAVLDRQFKVSGMPFPLMLRESSWPILDSRFASFMEGACIQERWGCKVRFLPSNLPANDSPAVVPGALVFVDYQPSVATSLLPLTPFEALVALQKGGFWVEHDRETIAGFLSWIAQLDRYRLTYSAIDEASQAVAGLLS